LAAVEVNVSNEPGQMLNEPLAVINGVIAAVAALTSTVDDVPPQDPPVVTK